MWIETRRIFLSKVKRNRIYFEIICCINNLRIHNLIAKNLFHLFISSIISVFISRNVRFMNRRLKFEGKIV